MKKKQALYERFCVPTNDRQSPNCKQFNKQTLNTSISERQFISKSSLKIYTVSWCDALHDKAWKRTIS